MRFSVSKFGTVQTDGVNITVRFRPFEPTVSTVGGSTVLAGGRPDSAGFGLNKIWYKNYKKKKKNRITVLVGVHNLLHVKNEKDCVVCVDNKGRSRRRKS